ncbi:MAG: elongation factor P [Rickettsiales bacterium]|jgi:elongation factor P|nr:elongation factor P [Rickettsiales bacterium]
MRNANAIKIGNVINFKGKLCVVVKTMHTQPGKGGAFVQMELKDIVAGTKYNERFRSNEDKIEVIRLDENELQFLYEDGDSYHCMDNKNFDQVTINKNQVHEEHRPFLTEGMNIMAQVYEGNILSISLPDTVEVEIETTESTVKGQTAASSNKPATLTNGIRIIVPSFIKDGDKILIKTETMTYLERVS